MRAARHPGAWAALAAETLARFGWPLIHRRTSRPVVRLRVHPLRRAVIVRARLEDHGRAARLIAAHAGEIAQRIAALPPPRPLVDGARLPWADGDILLRHDPDAPRAGRREGDRLVIGGGSAGFGARAARALRREAERELAGLVESCAGRLGVRVGAVRVKETVSRWGSASPAGVIALQWRLGFAPQMVRRYVAAHEAAHLVHPHHGPTFWRTVELLGVDPPSARGWLRTHGPALFAIGASW